MDKRGQPTNACWCGNSHLQDFSDTYSLCATCQTLVASRTFVHATTPVTDTTYQQRIASAIAAALQQWRTLNPPTRSTTGVNP